MEERNPDSALHYFRKMVKLRKSLPELVYGKYKLLEKNNLNVYAYTRTSGDRKVLVLLNFSDKTVIFDLPASIGKPGSILINNLKDHCIIKNSFDLLPWQSLIVRLK